jgi:hypothetical protein
MSFSSIRTPHRSSRLLALYGISSLPANRILTKNIELQCHRGTAPTTWDCYRSCHTQNYLRQAHAIKRCSTSMGPRGECAETIWRSIDEMRNSKRVQVLTAACSTHTTQAGINQSNWLRWRREPLSRWWWGSWRTCRRSGLEIPKWDFRGGMQRPYSHQAPIYFENSWADPGVSLYFRIAYSSIVYITPWSKESVLFLFGLDFLEFHEPNDTGRWRLIKPIKLDRGENITHSVNEFSCGTFETLS